MRVSHHRSRTPGIHRIIQEVPIRIAYPVYFLSDLFGRSFPEMDALLASDEADGPHQVLFVLDDGVVRHHPTLLEQIRGHARRATTRWQLAGEPLIVPGGEQAKNDPALITAIHDRIHQKGVCRHSYLVAVGGGAVLDMAGYAAATAHRGVRLIRVPTTVLAQNDSGVGVKNGVNAYGKKNFLGSFAPPHAVFNDLEFLHTLDDRDWRSGTSEAVKVALIKDPAFFEFLEAEAPHLAARDAEAMRTLVVRCAELHLAHIRESGDPFELGSSRPLDFGHWAAHKLEQMSGYAIRHGEAVAIGIALDCVYAGLIGLLPTTACERVLQVLETLGFDLFVPELLQRARPDADLPQVFDGLEEFREHLGGQLTILLLQEIGRSIEVHSVDHARYLQAIHVLRERARVPVDA